MPRIELVDSACVAPVTDVMVGVAEVLRRPTSPGAGVIINAPVYPPFFSTTKEIGRRVVEAPLARVRRSPRSRAWDHDHRRLEAWNFARPKCAVLVTEPGPTRALVDGFPDDLRDRVGHLGVLASTVAWRDGGGWLDDLLGVLDRNRRLVRVLSHPSPSRRGRLN